MGLFALRLRTIRETAGCPSYREMAAAAAFDASALAKAARGRRLPSWPVVCGCLDALGVPRQDWPDWKSAWASAYRATTRAGGCPGGQAGHADEHRPGGRVPALRAVPAPPRAYEPVFDRIVGPERFRQELRRLRASVGTPSYQQISLTSQRAHAGGGLPHACPRSTVGDLFRGTVRVSAWETVLAVLGALYLLGETRLTEATRAGWKRAWETTQPGARAVGQIPVPVAAGAMASLAEVVNRLGVAVAARMLVHLPAAEVAAVLTVLPPPTAGELLAAMSRGAPPRLSAVADPASAG